MGQDELDEITTYTEAKKCFKESENREPNMNNDKDMLAVSAIQIGIKYGYKMGYAEFYTTMCDKCKYRNATCFDPGAFCDECSQEEYYKEEEEEEEE